MNQLTFGNSAVLLRANGFTPAPLGTNGEPIGPWAVMQIDYGRYAENADLRVGVLTSVPVARNDAAPVQNAADTWLVALTISTHDELVKEADGIVAKYIGDAKCPVRVSEDGATLYVFRLSGAQFSRIATGTDGAQVVGAGSFIPVEGEWRGGISLLDVFRHDLPELDQQRAQSLIDELDAMLDAHTPPVEPPAPIVPRPLLERGQSLRYGNKRAMDALRENGFAPIAVRWTSGEEERNGFSDANGRWHHTVSVSEHGVAVAMKGFALVEFGTNRFRSDVDEAIRSMGACLVRSSGSLPAYLFRCDQGGPDETIFSPHVIVKIRRTGLTVLSGEGCKWDRDVLTLKARELATFEQHDGYRLQRLLESLPATDYSKPASKRRKTAA